MIESLAVETRATNMQEAGDGELIVSSLEPRVIQSKYAQIQR